jgi:hypothetical protein
MSKTVAASRLDHRAFAEVIPGRNLNEWRWLFFLM